MSVAVSLVTNTTGIDVPVGTAGNPLVIGEGLAKVSPLTGAMVSISSATDTTISTATPGQTTRVHRLRLGVTGANILTIKSGAATLEVLNFPASGFLTYDFDTIPWYVTATNAALIITTSTAAQVNGVVEFVKSA